MASLARLRDSRPRGAGDLPRGTLSRLLRERPGALEDWDLPYAYEALARAHLVAGNPDQAAHFGAHARELGERIADEEDREQLNADLATI